MGMEFRLRSSIRPQGVTLRSRGQALEECAAHGKKQPETVPDKGATHNRDSSNKATQLLRIAFY